MKLNNLLPARFRKDEVNIPVVRLGGVISPSSSPLQRNLNLGSVAGLLERAFSDKKTPAVVLAVNSPGGSPVQSRLITTRIRELAEKHEKKVYVFVEDVAASGGYMISLAGDEIYADETSVVGSIGVVSAGFGFDKAIEKLGVERRVYTAGSNKVSLDPFQPEKKSDIEYLKSLQLEIHQVFIDMVKERRGEKLVEDKDMFTGRFWTGAKAAELGLVDGLGHMSTILKAHYGDKTKLRLVQQKRGLFGRSPVGVSQIDSEGMGAQAGSAAVETLVEQANAHGLWARYAL